ncbi:MAG: DNA polymerase IV [Gammaproteobacteria bacterium]|nr:DNA polymerase IV [Gammaproteobacteria bacterium]MDH5728204.1 DNA polymerase IV [Gammaproteobacteria bacterium]
MDIRKIIHVDMDCFYAAIEIRDNPQLETKPVAVGGAADRRGVLCTCNYEARKFGIHSAMATAYAMRLCPDLIVLPVNMQKYKSVSQQIQAMFFDYTDLVEPLSLDEAFLDVSTSMHCNGSASLIARELRQRIHSDLGLSASAGISVNKFLAKLASDWKKPNGQFVIRPEEIEEFMLGLPVKKIFGVGKATASKLAEFNIETCADLQAKPYAWLNEHFGRFGHQLYFLSRGQDEREVSTSYQRKSLSVENTFMQDIDDESELQSVLIRLHQELLRRMHGLSPGLKGSIKTVFVKIKYADFQQSSTQHSARDATLTVFQLLLRKKRKQDARAVRLLGIGVQFSTDDAEAFVQQEMDFNLEL